MYQVGQKIVYGIHGVCSIVDLAEKRIDKKTICYFVLEPVDQPGSRYYLPSENQAALAKIRPLCTKEQLLAMLSTPISPDIWIQDENKRKQYYRELICSVDLKAMVDMVRLLRIHRQQQMELGRKFHLCDENFLRDAQRILTTEIAMVMGIPADQVDGFLHSSLE